MSGSQQSQGQQNTLSAFGFKPATTSNAPATNPSAGFGAFASTPSAFGGATNAGQNNATNTADASAAPKAPLFGGGGFGLAQNQGQTGQQSTPSGAGIFGTSSGTSLFPPAATPAGGQQSSVFGGNAPAPGGVSGSGGGSAPTTSTSPAPNPLFGGASSQPAAPATAPGSIFGGGTTTSGSSGSLFGPPSNPPAKPGNIFGGDKPSGGLFGGGTASGPSTGAAASPLSIFGASSNQPTSSNQNTGTTSNTAATPANSAPASTPNPLFGNAASNVSSSKAPTPPSPFSGFGTKPSDSSGQPSTSTTAPSGGGSALPSLFGGSANNTTTPAPSASASFTPSASSTPSLFANLPKKPETAPVPGATTTNPSGFSGFPSLTVPKDTNKDASKDAKPAPTGGLFGAPAGPGDSSKDSIKDTASKEGVAPSPFVGFSLGGNKDAGGSKPPATLGLAVPASTSGVPAPSITTSTVTSVPAPSMLRGKSVEDIVNRWTTELEMHTREFSQFASEVAVWDRTLIENGNYISALYATVLTAESTQTSLDQSLDHVEQQQRHLTAILDQYEKSASEILHGPGGIMTSNEGLGLADSERDKSYALAANLYTQLDDLSRSLTQMVESVNGLNLSPGPSQGSNGTEDASQEDAISTIAGILNAHLASLQWIDGSLKEMDGKVKDAERKIKDTGGRGGARTDGSDGISKSRSYGLGSSRR